MKHVAAIMGLCSAVVCTPVHAENARDILVNAAFGARDKGAALARIGQALASADAALKRDPRDENARLQRALAISYRGKLTRSRADVIAARREFEALVVADPRNPETHLALAGWHLAAVIELGPFMARTVLGARLAAGNAALNRAIALGGTHAAVPALASLQRIQIDPSDVAGARRLAETAVVASANNPFDRLMQRQAATLLVQLRKGDGMAAASLAKLLMPFGRISA